MYWIKQEVVSNKNILSWIFVIKNQIENNTKQTYPLNYKNTDEDEKVSRLSCKDLKIQNINEIVDTRDQLIWGV